jgi:hypothetical protein
LPVPHVGEARKFLYPAGIGEGDVEIYTIVNKSKGGYK